jgi:hypothetical protein
MYRWGTARFLEGNEERESFQRMRLRKKQRGFRTGSSSGFCREEKIDETQTMSTRPTSTRAETKTFGELRALVA